MFSHTSGTDIYIGVYIRVFPIVFLSSNLRLIISQKADKKTDAYTPRNHENNRTCMYINTMGKRSEIKTKRKKGRMCAEKKIGTNIVGTVLSFSSNANIATLRINGILLF